MSDLRKRNLRVLEVYLGAGGAAYTAGDQVGAVVDLNKVASVGARVQLVELKAFDDTGANAAELDVMLFSSAPADAGDNAAFVLSAADLEKLVVSGSIVAGDYNVVGTRGIASKVVGSVGQLPKSDVAGDGHLHLAVVTQTTPTLAASGLRLQIILEEES